MLTHQLDHLAQLESLLIWNFRPSFLSLTPVENSEIIEVVISSRSFNGTTISERIVKIFDEINKKYPELIENYLIVVCAFNKEEMETFLDDLLEQQINDWFI